MYSFKPFVLAGSLVLAASCASLVNCASPEDEQADEGADAVTGVNNTLGLSLVYDSTSSTVEATLKHPLAGGERLFIRVRRGTITHESQKDLDCGALAEAKPITKGSSLPNGKTIYQGPLVDRELVDLLSIYNDERWYGGHETPQMRAEVERGADAVVEACVLERGRVKAKLLTNLAYAWDRGEDLKRHIGLAGRSLRFLGGDGGTDETPGPDSIDDGREAGVADEHDAAPSRLPEGPAYNTIDYANLCTQELGEIPFFAKRGDGKYETFDCRDFVGSNGDRPGRPIEGVEGATIPLTIDDRPQTECSEGQRSARTYDCVNKCDRAMWLTASSHTGLGESAACQPGVTVTTAKNDRGTHWVLLCRKVDNSAGQSMMKTKIFNDIALIGNNPRTGKTCFFQNKEDIGNDGSRITHPGDVARSSAIWPATPASYCTGRCHGSDAFVHSPWIDQALRSNGKPIVPKMGEHPDFPISRLDAPYSVVNGEAQGFEVPPQLVSDEAAPCTTCHRVAGAAFAEFAEWSTGKGSAYFRKITDRYNEFEKSHWMPLRLEGLNAENFEESKWGVAVRHIRTCMDDENAEGCLFASVPHL